jgi:hypothetical protein
MRFSGPPRRREQAVFFTSGSLEIVILCQMNVKLLLLSGVSAEPGATRRIEHP